MSKWEKLLARILSLSKNIRFDELRKVLESYGYEMSVPKSGSSHYVFTMKVPDSGRVDGQACLHRRSDIGRAKVYEQVRR